MQSSLAERGVHVSYGEVTYLLRGFDALTAGWQELNKEGIRKPSPIKAAMCLAWTERIATKEKPCTFRDAVTCVILFADTAGDEEELRRLFE